MSTEIKSEGYQFLRNQIEDNWVYIELRNDINEPIVRLNINTDDRFDWTHTPGHQELTIEGTITGGDGDIGIGTTVKGSAIYMVSEGGESMHSSTDSPFTFEKEEDECKIVHSLQIPQV